MRSLVIGADGFVGRWLCAHLIASGDSVTAIVGPRYTTPIPGISDAVQVDVRELDELRSAIMAAEPDAIYYLAGVSRRGDRDALEGAAGVSVVGALGVLMAAADLATPPRILYVSTGLVYADAEVPRDEESPVAPHDMYAAAKYAGEVTLAQLGRVSGIDVVVARAFNHIGPGQSDGFVVPAIAQQIVRLGEEDRPVVRLAVGHTIRDFCDVRDVVRAYRLLVASAEPGRYNIGSGEGIRIIDLARLMLDVAGVSAEIVVEHAEAPGQPRAVIANVARMEGLGWRREFSLRESVAAVLEEHRAGRGR